MCWPALFWSFFLIFQALFLCLSFCWTLCPVPALWSFATRFLLQLFQQSAVQLLLCFVRASEDSTREELGIGQRIAIYDDVARVNITWKGNEWGIHILTHYQSACHHKCQAGHGGTSGHLSDETNTDKFLHIKARWATGILVTAYPINAFHASLRLPFYNIS